MKIGNFQPLRLKKEIYKTKFSNHSIKSKIFNLKFIKSEENKVAFIIKKKIANAVKRNKIKRRIRSVLSLIKNNSEIKINLIFIVKQEILEANFQQIKDNIENCCKKCYELINEK